MPRHVRADTALTVAPDGTGCTELRVTVTVPPKRPVSRSKRSTILPGVFPPGSWPHPVGTPNLHAKAVAEYQYLRSASGICRSCPNKLGRWKHRCDACQEKERIRLRNSGKAARSGRSLKHGFKKRSASKFKRSAKRWLKLRRQQQENA